jgi:hypothetical protein
MPEKATSRVSGVINPAEIYHRDEFLDRMRWGKHACLGGRTQGRTVQSSVEDHLDGIPRPL